VVKHIPGKLTVPDCQNIWDFSTGRYDAGCGGNNRGTPVKSSPPANQQEAFYRPDALPVAQPTASEHWRESITFHGLAHPKLTWRSSDLVWTSKGGWGEGSKPLVSPLTPVPRERAFNNRLKYSKFFVRGVGNLTTCSRPVDRWYCTTCHPAQRKIPYSIKGQGSYSLVDLDRWLGSLCHAQEYC